MEFEAYLKGKKIDSAAYRKGEEAQYNSFKNLFDEISPESFTQQKLFLINKIRRNFPLKEETEEKKVMAAKAMRPKIKPNKPKIN